MKRILHRLIGSFINLVGYFSKEQAASIALGLFTTPLKGYIKKDQVEFLDTSFKEEFNYDKNTITTYRWPGKGKTVLLVHGWESNSYRWKDLIVRLKSSNFNIIALDAPAHGKSGGKRFTAVLYSEFLNVVIKRFKPDIIIGHSAGGMASVFTLEKYKHPSVKKLVLLSSPSEFKDILSRYVKMLKLNKRVSKHLKTLIYNRFNKFPEDFSTAKSCNNISIEGLIVHDKFDEIIPFGDAIKINNTLKNSKLIPTEGNNHSLNNEEIHNHIEDYILN